MSILTDICKKIFGIDKPTKDWQLKDVANAIAKVYIKDEEKDIPIVLEAVLTPILSKYLTQKQIHSLVLWTLAQVKRNNPESSLWRN